MRHNKGREDIVVMVTGIRVGRSGVWMSAEANDVSFLQNVQTGYGAHLSPYSVGSGGVKRTNSYLVRAQEYLGLWRNCHYMPLWNV